jgi:hypothetical protein
LAVSSIAFHSKAGATAPAAEPTLDTPAELPSGRASFRDALGRETALERQRASSPKRGRARDGDASSLEAPVAPAGTHRPALEAKDAESSDPFSSPPAADDASSAASLERLLEDDGGDLSELTDAELAAFAEAGPAAATAAAGSAAGSTVTDGALPTAQDAVADSLGAALFAAANELATAATDAAPGDGPTAKLATKLADAGDALDPALAALLHPSHAAPPAEPHDAAPNGALAPIHEAHPIAATPAFDATAAVASPDRSAAASEKLVALAELPRALHAEVDGFLRVHGRGRHWEAELRLDPPELGALHIHLEMRGHAVHGVVKLEDPRLEPTLERFLQDLERDLQRQGSPASFDLSRGTQEGGEERSRPSLVREPPRAVSEVNEGAGPASDRLVDLLA